MNSPRIAEYIGRHLASRWPNADDHRRVQARATSEPADSVSVPGCDGSRRACAGAVDAFEAVMSRLKSAGALAKRPDARDKRSGAPR